MTWGQGDAIITYQPELVTLDPYSLLEQNHPVLLVFKLTDSYTIENDKPLSIKASIPCSYLASDTLSNKIASGTAGIDYVSKIGNVYYFPVSSVIDYYAVGTTTPSFDYHFSPDKSAFSSFVSFSPTPTFHHEVSLYSTVSVTDQSAITANTTLVVGDIRYVSVIFDYYSDAIQYLYSYNLGDAVLSDDLQYLCDFTMEI